MILPSDSTCTWKTFEMHLMKLWTNKVRNPTNSQQSNMADWPQGLLQCKSPDCWLVSVSEKTFTVVAMPHGKRASYIQITRI